MFRWLTRSEQRPLDIVLVSADPAVVRDVYAILPPSCRVVHIEDATTALAVLGSRPVHGAVVDGLLPGRMANVVSRAFLHHQPIGRVVVIAAADDPSSLIGSAYNDARVEVLFRPLDGETLRGCLLGVTAGALA